MEVYWEDAYGWNEESQSVEIQVGKIIETDYNDDVTGETITVLRGTGYSFGAEPQAGHTPPPPVNFPWIEPTCTWTLNGQQIGIGIGVYVPFTSTGTKTLVAKCGCCDTGKSVTINTVEPEVYQYGVFGDTQMYENPDTNEGWDNGIKLMIELVYYMGYTNPFCVTKNSEYISLTNVRLKVPNALTYGTSIYLEASGTQEWWGEGSVTFTQGDVNSSEGTLDLVGNFVDMVKKYDNNFIIQWKYWQYNINQTGNTVYVTYGDPYPPGNSVTKKRIDKLCTWANGQDTRKKVADAINSNLYPPFRSQQPQSDDWNLMCSSHKYHGECDEHARFMVRCLSLIGIPQAYDYNTYASDADPDNNYVLDVMALDSNYVNGKIYYLKFDANRDDEVDNNFEGSLVVALNDELTAFQGYTVTPKLSAPTSCQLWRLIGPERENWWQKWVYSPSGEFKDARPWEEHLPGHEPYISCPQ